MRPYVTKSSTTAPNMLQRTVALVDVTETSRAYRRLQGTLAASATMIEIVSKAVITSAVHAMPIERVVQAYVSTLKSPCNTCTLSHQLGAPHHSGMHLDPSNHVVDKEIEYQQHCGGEHIWNGRSFCLPSPVRFKTHEHPVNAHLSMVVDHSLR